MKTLDCFKYLAMAIAVAFGGVFANENALLILQIGASADDNNNISHSFVELYNAGNEDINLSGYSLQYAEGTKVSVNATQDSEWNKIDLSGTIQSGHSFLILGAKRSTNLSPALKIDDNYGDINLSFKLSNRAVKVALINNTVLLAVQNPFDIDGNGTKTAGYVDMIGVINDNTDRIFGYEGAVPTGAADFRITKQVGVRRTSLIDADNNSTDFETVTYASVTAEEKEVKRPKNHAYGAWNPYPEAEEEIEPTVAGEPSELAGKLLILQAGAATNGAIARNFVELYNNTDNSIILTDAYSLQYAGATGTDWNVINLDGTIPAKASFLVVGKAAEIHNDNRLFIKDNEADQIVGDGFILSNNGFKAALMANRKKLTVANPFDMTGSKAADYVDMLGAYNSGAQPDGYETAVAAVISKQASARRSSLTDTDNNGADFERIDYRASGITDEQLEKYRPKDSNFGTWNPITGEWILPDIDGGASKITSFKFSYASIGWEGDDYLEGIIDDENRTVTFTTQKWIENIDKLPAIFELDERGVARVGAKPQWSAITRNDFRKDVVYTVGDASYTVKFASPQASGLPVIRIDTKNNAPILDKENYVNMTFALTDPNNPNNNITVVNNTDGIRGRGNDSWHNYNALKKSYRIKFDKKNSLFGLESAKSWVLIAQYRDPTLLFNSIAFEFGNKFDLPYNHSFRYVELYLNGEYKGNYLLTEQNQAGKGRVDIDEDEGWFVEMDGNYYYEGEPKFRTTNYDLPVMIRSPEVEPANMSNPAYDFVKKDINELCDSLASANFPENRYESLINMNTFIDFLMITEIVDNKEIKAPMSTYLYKDKDDMINMGPLWDFDCGYGYNYNYIHFNNPNTRTPMQSFFKRFFDDPKFLAKYKERWNEKYSDISSINDFIDMTANRIEKSAVENFKTWWYRNISRWWIESYGEEDNDFWQEISNLKNYLNAHISYLNAELNKVEILPANKTFAAQTFGYSQELSAQKFTLVAYGDMEDLSAAFQKGESSGFEISVELSKTATGNGGYLAAISVKPKNSLSAATYTDALVLSGSNQGKQFRVEVPLTFVVKGEEVSIGNGRSPETFAGILLDSNIVSQSAKITVIMPEQARVNLVIYDNLGNTVFEASGRNSTGIVWNLTNKAGRNAANGSYLIIAEARGKSGRIYLYKKKVGVKR